MEANLGAMERHVAAMLDESTTDKEATDKAASLLSTEETTGMEAFAVALEGNTDKEASLSGEQHIAQGLLSEETETEGEEREVVKSLLGSRGGATADDATADETQVTAHTEAITHTTRNDRHPSQTSITDTGIHTRQGTASAPSVPIHPHTHHPTPLLPSAHPSPSHLPPHFLLLRPRPPPPVASTSPPPPLTVACSRCPFSWVWPFLVSCC